jgi:hypothetical protein
MLMHAGDKELTSLLARLHATDGTRVGSVLWDYYAGNFDRKWYATMADEADNILATLDSANISEGHVALLCFIDGLRHSATDRLAFRTFWNVRETRDRWNKASGEGGEELQAYVEKLQLQLRTHGAAWDERIGKATAAFTHLQAEMKKFIAHYYFGDNVWDNTNGVW